MIRVHSYESMGTFDGPGLRLVVFLQGCNFRCLYCANPDTIDIKGESTETPIDEIIRMAVSQKAFFGKKGGITFSGGEPTLQAKALIPLFRRLKEQGIHICVDTNGSIWNEDVEELLKLTDLVLLDIKEFNNTRHLQLTERSKLTATRFLAEFQIRIHNGWLFNARIDDQSLIFFTIFRMFHSYFFEVTFTLIIIFGLFGSFVIINTRGEPFTLLRLCP